MRSDEVLPRRASKLTLVLEMPRLTVSALFEETVIWLRAQVQLRKIWKAALRYRGCLTR